MTSIHETLKRLNEADREKFITMRMSMRRTYLMCIQASVGMARYCAEDDCFMDAIDIKMEMLANRAGISTTNIERREPEINANDPFAMLTRIPMAIEKPQEVKTPDNEWKQPK